MEGYWFLRRLNLISIIWTNIVLSGCVLMHFYTAPLLIFKWHIPFVSFYIFIKYTVMQ
jgi:hypothetical protein